ncbi:MAG: hypothetical protein ACHQ2Z_11360 [Elusimicrobiota bacterium]
MIAASLLLVLSAQAWSQAWPPVGAESLKPAVIRPAYSADQLRAALLSREGVGKVRALFAAAAESAALFRFPVPVPHISGEWAEAKQLDSMAVFPTLAGSFEIKGGRAVFERRADPVLAVMRALAASAEDPVRLNEIYSAHPAELEIIDGGESAHILRHTLDAAPRIPPAPDRERRGALMLGRAALTVVENCSESYPRLLAERGAVWHVHPPHFAANGWYVGPVAGDDEGSPTPSDFDRGSAAERGQNLTLVFQSDGFDAYDLSSGRKIEYRSDDWRRGFEALHAEIARRLDPSKP